MSNMGKVALVNGASSGIGLAVAERLLDASAFAARLATWEAWEELSTAAQGVSITREVEV